VGRYRFPFIGLSNKRTNEKLSQFHYLISQLDSLRAFRRVDPAKLENSVEKTNAASLWNRIRPGVERIAFLPDSIPGLSKLIRISATLRLLFPLCFFSFFLAILIRVGIFALTSVYLFNIFLFGPLIIMVSFVAVDFMIRKKVARYEKEHPDLHIEEKDQIKKAVDELILNFIREMKLYKENPDQYQMRLYFNDYRGTRVISERREKIFGVFKRSYSTFTTILALDYKGKRTT
jgi:hypothetical protein